jgi:hypothetical protein
MGERRADLQVNVLESGIGGSAEAKGMVGASTMEMKMRMCRRGVVVVCQELGVEGEGASWLGVACIA